MHQLTLSLNHIVLFEEGKLSDFDFSFTKNWIGKKVNGHHFYVDEQARNLAILFSNKLGEKMYTTAAPLLCLPSERQARQLRVKEAKVYHYLPGLNGWAFERPNKMLVRNANFCKLGWME